MIVARDFARMQDYVSPPENFFSDGKLTPDIETFLYDGPELRKRDKEFRSIAEIAQLGAHTVKTVLQADGRITFYWIPKKYLTDANEGAFFDDAWMKKYFACEFHLVDGKYKLAFNFCFAQTGGPHHPPYG